MFEELFAKIKEIVREVFREEQEREDLEIKIKQYPPLLTRKDLGEIFQSTQSVISRIVKIESFPKFNHIQGRYPRDLVFKWIEENSQHHEVKGKLKAS